MISTLGLAHLPKEKIALAFGLNVSVCLAHLQQDITAYEKWLSVYNMLRFEHPHEEEMCGTTDKNCITLLETKLKVQGKIVAIKNGMIDFEKTFKQILQTDF